MTEHDEKVLPAKCRHCDKPMSAPLVCDYCHALNPIPAVTDYFALLSVPRQFALDDRELHRKFLALNRHAHPDFHVAESPEVRKLSLRVCSSVNDAYRTLKDPARRAAYLLELLGGKSMPEDKSVPDGFLATMMMMQEEIADAGFAGNAGELSRMREVLRTQHDGLMKRVEGLFDRYDRSVACEADRSDLLGQIRRQLNAVSYVKKLLSQL